MLTIDLYCKVELLVQSRNVRERLDGHEPLQDMPEGPSEQALLSQQEEMLQEIQNSQDRLQGQPTQPQRLHAPSGHAGSCSHDSSLQHCGNTPEHSTSASPGAASGHGGVATDEMESSLGPAVNQDATVVLPTAVVPIQQQPDHRQHPSQAVQLSDESRQAEEPALHAASDLQLSAAIPLQEQQHKPQMVVQAASALCLGKGASGVLAIDDSDDLDFDFELAQQMEDAARAAKDTQSTQQGAHAPLHAKTDSKPKGNSSSASMQTQQPAPEQAGPKPAEQTTLYTAGTAQQHSRLAGIARNPQPADVVASHPGNAQTSTFCSSNAFPDNDMVIDDDLAQLLDAATALRPAGPPDTALAGPGPASTSSSHSNSRTNAPRSRPNSAGSRPGLSGPRPNSPASLHQAVPSCDAKLPEQANRALGVLTQANEVLPKSKHQLCGVTSPARDADDGMVALEPAGPADLADLHVSMACLDI